MHGQEFEVLPPTSSHKTGLDKNTLNKQPAETCRYGFALIKDLPDRTDKVGIRS